MPVETDGVGDRLAVGAPDDDHGDLRRELDPPLGDARDLVEARPGDVGILGPVDAGPAPCRRSPTRPS